MTTPWFWIGVSVGILLTIPFAAAVLHRYGQRVRRLEKRAAVAERLADLGTLTGGLAHEIKNPLSTIGLNVQLVREDLEALAQDPVHADKVGRIIRRVDAMNRETDRLRHILEDFLHYAGRINLERSPVDVNQLINELTDFFAPQAQAAKVNLRTQLDASPAVVQADAGLLKQALLNLMINACQAMNDARDGNKPSGGNDELIIRTNRSKSMGVPELHIHVIDTGPGFAPENVEKAFRPYFSTKKGGTGLGLPTTRRIIEEHGGAIRFHSEPGTGTDFVITLPAGDGVK